MSKEFGIWIDFFFEGKFHRVLAISLDGEDEERAEPVESDVNLQRRIVDETLKAREDFVWRRSKIESKYSKVPSDIRYGM